MEQAQLVKPEVAEHKDLGVNYQQLEKQLADLKTQLAGFDEERGKIKGRLAEAKKFSELLKAYAKWIGELKKKHPNYLKQEYNVTGAKKEARDRGAEIRNNYLHMLPIRLADKATLRAVPELIEKDRRELLELEQKRTSTLKCIDAISRTIAYEAKRAQEELKSNALQAYSNWREFFGVGEKQVKVGDQRTIADADGKHVCEVTELKVGVHRNPQYRPDEPVSVVETCRIAVSISPPFIEHDSIRYLESEAPPRGAGVKVLERSAFASEDGRKWVTEEIEETISSEIETTVTPIGGTDKARNLRSDAFEEAARLAAPVIERPPTARTNCVPHQLTFEEWTRLVRNKVRVFPDDEAFAIGDTYYTYNGTSQSLRSSWAKNGPSTNQRVMVRKDMRMTPVSSDKLKVCVNSQGQLDFDCVKEIAERMTAAQNYRSLLYEAAMTDLLPMLVANIDCLVDLEAIAKAKEAVAAEVARISEIAIRRSK